MDMRISCIHGFAALIHGFVFEGRPARISVSSNSVNANANFRFASTCAWVGPGNAQGERLHDAIRESVRRTGEWGLGRIVSTPPHSSVIATQCPGDELRGLINRGAFLPGTTQPPGRNPWNMSVQDFENAMRRVLNEATPHGMTSWAQSYRDFVYQLAHNFLRGGAQGINIPRLDANGQPSMTTPSRLGNVLAFMDSRIADIQQRLAAIERRLDNQ